MGSAVAIGIRMRKLLTLPIRASYRSVCNHPFLMGLLGFLILLQRSFPFLFSLLVSSSPVLVCTALLLGTLLSFGQPNIPEIEKEDKVTHDISSLQTGFSEGDIVIAERDESSVVKRYTENRSTIEERGTEEASLAGDKVNKVEEDDGLQSYVPLIFENSHSVQHENQANEEMRRELRSFELEKTREDHEEILKAEGVSSDEEAVEKQYVMVQRVNNNIIDFGNEKTLVDALETFKEDHLDISPSSSWKQEENNHEEEDSLESGSDQAESSSPDASMADMIPLLDELHPLLDLEEPRPAHLSHDDSDAASEISQKSDVDSVESDEDNENRGEVEEDGVDEHDDEEEEDVEGGKEDESKSAIKWTEDDQKNLMDLGTSELERNQRLENLIARRRARRQMTEKNLIDLDSADLPFHVTPIMTTRRNPFDFPDDSYTGMGLPPIPGSAPSVLLPRLNPFDIPYDPTEEKPDLKGDSFQQEFAMFNQKDTIFKRHESFSVGPSVLGINKHERQNINWKPVFISEQMASEGTSFSSFQRQSSEVSDSKLSSVRDTESVSSTDQEERQFNDNEQDLSQEADLISNIDNVSDRVEHESQSSGEIDSVNMIQVEESNVHHDEVEIVLGGVENPSEMELYSETGEVSIHEELNRVETNFRREPVDEESSISSQSSLSEVIDSIPHEKIKESSSLRQAENRHEESGISAQESDFQFVSGEVDDSQHREPVYDSSPPADGKVRSLSSVSSDSVTVCFERASPLASSEMTANVTDKESEVHDQRPEDKASILEEIHAVCSKLPMEVKNELRSGDSKDKNQHDAATVELSVVAASVVDQNGSTAPESVVVPVSMDSSLSLDIGSVNNTGFVHQEDQVDHSHADSEILEDNVYSPASNYHMASENSHSSNNESVDEGTVRSSFDNEIMYEAVQDADEKLNLVVSDPQHLPLSDSSTSAPLDLEPSLLGGQTLVASPNLPLEENEHLEKNSLIIESMVKVEQGKVFSSSSDGQGNPDLHQDLDKKVVSSSADHQYVQFEGNIPSNLENNQASSDKSVVVPSSFSDRDQSQKSFASQAESSPVSTSKNGVGELYESVTSYSSETREFKSPMEINRLGAEINKDQNEVLEDLNPSAEGIKSPVTEENIKELDELKEIDQQLSELDAVGDFRISDPGLSLHPDLVIEETAVKDAQERSLPRHLNIAELEQGIPVLEVRSLEDIDLALKQLQEGEDVKNIIFPNMIMDQFFKEEAKDHLETNSDLQVVEAKPLDDINIALKEVPEGNQGELPKALDVQEGSFELEANDVGSAQVVELCDVNSGTEELSRTPVDKLKDVKSGTENMGGTPVEKLENVPISSFGDEAKSNGRRSSSSSSSSSSDSD